MTTTDITPEMEALKTRLKATWEAGDYGHFAQYLLQGALEFFDRLEIPAGTKMLDIGCGAGQLTLPAARKGIDVVGVDLAQNLVDQANAKINEEGLKAEVRQGDAENLAFPDASFDVSLSLIGSMFAPRPNLVASEMLRVTKPGGKVIMGNWTPASHVGQIFKIVGKFVPPPPIFPSPLLWGTEEALRERLGPGVDELNIVERSYPMVYPFTPAEVADFFIEYYGPTKKVFGSLDPSGQEAFRSEFADLWARNNLASDGTTLVQSVYLEVIGTRQLTW